MASASNGRRASGDRVLIDTGPIVAILDSSDEHHSICVDQLRHLRAPLFTCWPVVTEAAWLLRARPADIGRLMASFNQRLFGLLPLNEPDVPAIAAIVERYRSLNIQLADASLVHLANREGTDTIFTLDRRDFGILRMARGKKFRLIP